MTPSSQYIIPSTLRHIENEIPVGIIDGTNVTFYTEYRFFNDSCQIYLNGLRLLLGPSFDYTVPNDQSFVLNYPPLPGDVLTIDYFRK